jgi:hypothetical protein
MDGIDFRCDRVANGYYATLSVLVFVGIMYFWVMVVLLFLNMQHSKILECICLPAITSLLISIILKFFNMFEYSFYNTLLLFNYYLKSNLTVGAFSAPASAL